MRTAVVFFGGKSRDSVRDVAQAIADGISAQGHTCDLIDGERDVNSRLTGYGYVVLGTQSVSLFGGRIPASVAEFLGRAGIVSGRKSFAFVVRTPFGSAKALGRLMKSMEHEGMFLRFSEVIRSTQEATAIARRLKIDA